MANAAPLVTFTFDDCPQTAVREGASALERHGLKGSFYLAGGLAGRDWENGPQFHASDVQRLLARGHEVGCHTFSHLDCATATAAQIAEDLASNRDFLLRAAPDLVLETFAYPYGSVGLATKIAIQGKYLACRGVEAGLNAGTADFGLLKAVSLPHDDSGGDWIEPWLARAKRENGWLVLYTHDVSPLPTPFGATPRTLNETIAAVQAAGIEVLTLRDAALRVSRGRALVA
jgi:peptidoglycan/xylan/chitin deacetylase (PgdA/CDA1 family)